MLFGSSSGHPRKLPLSPSAPPPRHTAIYYARQRNSSGRSTEIAGPEDISTTHKCEILVLDCSPLSDQPAGPRAGGWVGYGDRAEEKQLSAPETGGSHRPKWKPRRSHGAFLKGEQAKHRKPRRRKREAAAAPGGKAAPVFSALAVGSGPGKQGISPPGPPGAWAKPLGRGTGCSGARGGGGGERGGGA